ncbi:MAG: hypothetical protein MK165_14405 [Pirellulaceae bacterium]|nr:hypothetical protein [Pirellulaceae bacterium]
MSFEERLQKAIERGHHRREVKKQDITSKALSDEDLKRLHLQFRLTISEHIESCVEKLANQFPGFQFETLFGDCGWGAACSRDDLQIPAKGVDRILGDTNWKAQSVHATRSVKTKRTNAYSRLEMTIRPFSHLQVVDLAAKGTIRNKEVFNRNYFEKIADVDSMKFIELIDVWVLEYAELFAAKLD